MSRYRKTLVSAAVAASLLLSGAAQATPGDIAFTGSAPASKEYPSGDIDVSPMSATSCQATIGALGATQCFTALSPGVLPTVRIISLQIDYAATANICDKHYQFRYRPAGQTFNTVTGRSDSGCSYAYASNKLTLNRDMQNGSQVCARQRNSATNQEWTAWYCHNVWG